MTNNNLQITHQIVGTCVHIMTYESNISAFAFSSQF